MKCNCAVVLALSLFCWCAELQAIPVAINFGQVTVWADDDVPNDPPESDIIDFRDIAFGINETLSVTDGNATTSSAYETFNSSTEAVIDVHAAQFAFGLGGKLSQSSGFVNFTLAEAARYEISGQLTGSGNDADDSYWLEAFLIDPELLSSIYLESEFERGVSASYALNDEKEAGIFPVEGSRFGVLPPGTYQLQYVLKVTDADMDGAGTSSATGHLRFALRPVPEPGTFVLFASAVSAALMTRRR